jgi:hypothetical protein
LCLAYGILNGDARRLVRTFWRQPVSIEQKHQQAHCHQGSTEETQPNIKAALRSLLDRETVASDRTKLCAFQVLLAAIGTLHASLPFLLMMAYSPAIVDRSALQLPYKERQLLFPGILDGQF